MSESRPRKSRGSARELKGRMVEAMASSCLSNFIEYTKPDYRMGWFHEEICDRLDDFLNRVAREESPRLMITAPPRHGKSEIVSRRFPAYVFGKYPDMSIISTSYSADLSSRMNRDVQRIIDDGAYRRLFPGTRLWERGVRAPGGGAWQRNTDMFEIVGRGGSYRSAGVGGGITGMGGHCLVIDDPIKNREEADSVAIRDKIWEWYTSTLYTRLSPGGGIVIIQTRWHEDDLAGRLLEGMRTGEGETWETLNYPAIAEADDGHRAAGEALHEERYPLKTLERIRYAVGLRDFAALYQQRPAPESGAVFRREWFRRWKPADLPDSFDTVVMSWDMSFKEASGSDFVVGQVWGKKGAQAFLLDQVRRRMGFVDTCQAVKAMAGKWPEAGEKYVEDTANGPAVIDALKKLVGRIIPVSPEGSKRARAHAVTGYVEAGNVLFPADAEWARELEQELLTFPAGAHDDQVDALTQALRKLMQRAVGAQIRSFGQRGAGGGSWGIAGRGGPSWGFSY